MGTLARAQEICAVLIAANVRATTDPAVLAPPCFLVMPPNLEWDTGCGATLTWQVVALAPAAQTADRTSWELLDELLDVAYQTLDVRSATLQSYVVNGRTYPAYVVQWNEAS